MSVNGAAHSEVGEERSMEGGTYDTGATNGLSREVRGDAVPGTGGGSACRGLCAGRVVREVRPPMERGGRRNGPEHGKSRKMHGRTVNGTM